MLYTNSLCCRICKNKKLQAIFDLGNQALTGVFPKSRFEKVPSGPVELVRCLESEGGCGLVQLKQSYNPDAMYGSNYGYRSGLNQSMVNHLKKRAQKALKYAMPNNNDCILDIGSNDCTLLRNYSNNFDLIGMDPSGFKFKNYYPDHVTLVPEFFSSQSFKKTSKGKKAKIVTSIAMFYDLEDPTKFMSEIYDVIDDEGVWVFEQSYLPTMLEMNAYDTICHEHISYYALKQIKWMTDRTGFKIIDIELNDINGGSFCVTVAKRESSHQEAFERINEITETEEGLKLSKINPFVSFVKRIEDHRKQLVEFIDSENRRGKKIYGYGASTKGNVILQYCSLGCRDIKGIAEVNCEKYGSFTPGTWIPIDSESKIKSLNPDYLLVLPWHFKAGIIKREESFIAKGGRFVFPLPKLEIVDGSNFKEVA